MVFGGKAKSQLIGEHLKCALLVLALLALKYLPENNTLAYFGSFSLTKNIFHFELNSVAIVIRLFTAVSYEFLCLLLARLSRVVHCFLARPGAFPRGEHLKDVSLG
jgi:hypothetical protein